MSRIAQRFADLQAQGRVALVPYLTAGDPTSAATVPVMHALVAAGADIIELGVPFSDPMADGPVIQQACERALAGGMTLLGVLAQVAEFRRNDPRTPVVLMGYVNPFECMGHAAFAAAAAEAGVDGVLTVDLPPEEAAEPAAALRAHGLDPIFLLAPTSTAERVRQIGAVASGYLYYVALKGVTGSAALDVADVEQRLRAIRAEVSIPVGVGFGIRDAASAAAVAGVADAVIVGSALVSRLAALGGDIDAMCREAGALIGEMREAIDASARRPA